MKSLKINESPVRTARNFNINNIKLENIEKPENIEQFEKLSITGNLANIEIEENLDERKLFYGLSEELTDEVNQNSNLKLKWIIDNKNNEELKMEYEFDENNKVLLENVQIIANENSKSTIIIKYIGDENLSIYHNGIIKVNARSNSNLNIIILNLINNKSNNFLAIENIIENNAKVNYTIIDFGGKNSITNYYSNLVGEKSDNKINTIYLGNKNQLFDLNYIAELRGEKSNIDIEVQGALKDSAKKHFKGIIDFKKGCKKATGNENEACMLLSDNAKSIALPMLLCSEEDVEGNHSSSAGKIGEKELFYIMSRGFELKEAMKLMVRAKFNKILENIQNQDLKQEIINQIDNRLE